MNDTSLCILFCGQMRTFENENILNSYKTYLSKFGKIDIYISTWKNIGYSNREGQHNRHSRENEIITYERIFNNYSKIDFFSIKEIIIDDFDNFYNYMNDDMKNIYNLPFRHHSSNNTSIPILYKYQKCVNGIFLDNNYSKVLIMRPDFAIIDNLPLHIKDYNNYNELDENTIYFKSININCIDHFWFSSQSTIFKQLNNIFDSYIKLHKEINDTCVNKLLKQQCHNNNINIISNYGSYFTQLVFPKLENIGKIEEKKEMELSIVGTNFKSNKIIGISITNNFINYLYSSGINLNTLVWYDFFTNLGYTVYFIAENNTEDWSSFSNYKLLNYQEVFENYEIDILLIINFYHDFLHDKLLEINPNMKSIHINLGNNYSNFLFDLIKQKNDDPIKNSLLALTRGDEIWISPHFSFSKHFYELLCNSTYVAPFIWSNILIKNIKINLNIGSKLTVAIAEPNLHPSKNNIFPLLICNKGEKYIDKVKVIGLSDLHKFNRELNTLLSNSALAKNGKLETTGRIKFIEIFNKLNCNCLISFQENWDLNYTYLECFYLGIPLIHNSKILKNYGYYYPDYDIDKAVEQLENILTNHNQEEYIMKHKEILEYYSINNKKAINWVNNRIDNIESRDYELMINSK